MSLLVSLLNPSSGGSSNDKGYFVDQAALEAAYPVGQAGWYAVVGSTDTIWIWDTDTNAWVDSGFSTMGTVTSVSVATANGLAGSVANPTTTPVITLRTTVSGILQGDGTSISASNLQVSGDYSILLRANDPVDVTLPESGTLATLSDLSGLVPYVGAVDNLNLGDYQLIATQVNTPSLQLYGSSSGGTYLQPAAIASGTQTLQAASGTVALLENTLNQFANTSASSLGAKLTGGADGQLFIGKTDGTFVPATLTEGSNITITNGNGSITIAANPSPARPTYYNFSSTTLVTVTHNLGYKPIVQVMDDTGEMITDGVDIDHVSDNQFTIASDLAISGTAMYLGGSSGTPAEYTFTSSTLITVTHNLGYKPIIQVLDESGEMITDGVDIDHVGNDEFTVASLIAISGTILYL